MQIKITLKPEIYEKMKENARANMRTLSAEINFVLKEAYAVSEVIEVISESEVPKEDSWLA